MEFFFFNHSFDLILNAATHIEAPTVLQDMLKLKAPGRCRVWVGVHSKREDGLYADSLDSIPSSPFLECIALGTHYVFLDVPFLSCAVGVLMVPHRWRGLNKIMQVTCQA